MCSFSLHWHISVYRMDSCLLELKRFFWYNDWTPWIEVQTVPLLMDLSVCLPHILRLPLPFSLVCSSFVRLNILAAREIWLSLNATSQMVTHPPLLSPSFKCRAWCHMAWIILLASWGQLSWLRPLPTPCAPPTHLMQNTASYELLWRKLTLSQTKSVQLIKIKNSLKIISKIHRCWVGSVV